MLLLLLLLLRGSSALLCHCCQNLALTHKHVHQVGDDFSGLGANDATRSTQIHASASSKTIRRCPHLVQMGRDGPAGLEGGLLSPPPSEQQY